MLSQFSTCPGISMATDDVITTTVDVIAAIHIIFLDLEGKLTCCKKFVCFYDNKFSTSKLFSGITHGNIDATIITQQNMLLVKVSLYQKLFHQKRVLGYNSAKWQATKELVFKILLVVSTNLRMTDNFSRYSKSRMFSVCPWTVMNIYWY